MGEQDWEPTRERNPARTMLIGMLMAIVGGGLFLECAGLVFDAMAADCEDIQCGYQGEVAGWKYLLAAATGVVALVGAVLFVAGILGALADSTRRR